VKQTAQQGDRASPAGRWGAVLWPSFLGAAALNALLFSVVDPQALHGLGSAAPLAWSDRTLYTVAFFVLWLAIAACSATTLWLVGTAGEVNVAPRR
jgi:hypothetical protein